MHRLSTRSVCSFFGAVVALATVLTTAVPASGFFVAMPILKLDPTSGLPGTRVTVSGSGWPSLTTGNTITWNTKSGNLLKTFSTNPNGAFSTKIKIPSDASAGTHDVWACVKPQGPCVSRPFRVIPRPTPTPTPQPTACDPSDEPGETVIRFDDRASGESLRDLWLPEGIIFTEDKPIVEALATAHSGPNVLINYSHDVEFGSAGEPLEFRFSNVQSFVGVFVGAHQSEGQAFTATLTAYGEDDEGNPVVLGTDSAELGPDAQPVDTCLSVQSEEPILRAAVNYGPGATVGIPEVIDDLILRGPEIPIPIPEDESPPVVEIDVPPEGAYLSDVNVSVRGRILENRELDRVELWANGVLYKAIGAARMGLTEYLFADFVEGSELRACEENLLEVRAHDTGGLSGSDQVSFFYLGAGDLELVSVEPVQVIYGARLVKDKATAFRAHVNSTFPCQLDTDFRLELPDSEWSTSPPSTGRLITGTPPDWEYPEIWGPAEIPAFATDYEVMLPYVQPGDEDEGFGMTEGAAGLIHPRESGGILGPNVRVVPRPTGSAARFSVEIDPEDALYETDEANNSFHSDSYEVVPTRGLRIIFVPWIFNLEPPPHETLSSMAYYLNQRGYTDVETRMGNIRREAEDGRVALSLALTSEDIERLRRDAQRYTDFLLGSYPIADSKISYSFDDSYLYFREDYLETHGFDRCAGDFMGEMYAQIIEENPGFDMVIMLTIFGCCGSSPVGVGFGRWAVNHIFYADAGIELPWGPSWDHACNEDDDPWEFIYGQASSYVAGHEMAHNLTGAPDCYACRDEDYDGADCAYCNLDADGFWVNRWMPFEVGEQCFMHAVCDICTYWSRLEPTKTKSGSDNPDGYFNALEYFYSLADPEVLLVTGTLDRQGNATFGDFAVLQDGVVDMEGTEDGQYSLVLLDEARQELVEHRFNVSFEFAPRYPETIRTLDRVSLAFRIPWLPETRQVELRTSEGDVLATKSVTSHEPTVRLVEPVGGEEVNKGSVVMVRWEAQDEDGDSLSFSVALSSDEGETWSPVMRDLQQTEFALSTIPLREDGSYLVRVRASDGVNTGEAVLTTPFTVLAGVTEPAGTNIPVLVIAAVVVVVLGLILAAIFLARRKAAA